MKAFCLALDSRIEYWQDLESQAKKLDIDFKAFIVGDGTFLDKNRYDYIDEPNPDITNWGYGQPKFKKNHYNAFMAHMEILKQAKQEQLPYFLMLEDDAYFTARYEHVYNTICHHYYDLSFDIIYFGWWIGDENDEWNKNIEKGYNERQEIGLMKAKQIGGLHGALINNSMYDYLLSLPANNPIDCQLNQIHDQIKSYVILPKIIHTKSIWSYCEGSVINRNHL